MEKILQKGLIKMKMEIINGIKTIFIGDKNDAKVYATKDFTPLNKEDLEFVTPEFIIKCDSGIYPVSNFEQYICNQASEWFNN